LNQVDLSKFNNAWYNPGRGICMRICWYMVNAIFFKSALVFPSQFKPFLLRQFGAKIGVGVVIKPSVNIKYPWNLEIGLNSWIGEEVWIDSLAKVTIGKNVCISQGAYLCTGNHDWGRADFDLRIAEIAISDGSWVGAKAIVMGGAVVSSHSIVTVGSVLSGTTASYSIYSGNPAIKVKTRYIE
jgi:putative colanic acid biosynthesis acetyltransferase WcaF